VKRSEINALIRDAEQRLERWGVALPPFARWTPVGWQAKGAEIREIVSSGLGWDITDFGQGRYTELGLLLFTLRNSSLEHLRGGQGKVYAEKLLLVGVNQLTPMHFHWHKTEDIINRNGGRLAIQLYNSRSDGTLSDTHVVVNTDGVERRLEAGATLRLEPGESITLTAGLYHSFWAEGDAVLVGEVSSVNDDHTDNCFLEPLGRFPAIEENEAPYRFLVGDTSSLGG
jgi:hypothetical protein